MTNRLREIEALGQAVWIDNINRELLEDGILQRLVDEDGISGVTSNPTIFEKAMGHSDRYDEGFKRVLDETQDPQEIFFRLAYRDIRDAPTSAGPTGDRGSGRLHLVRAAARAGLRRRGLRGGGQALLRRDRQGQRPHQGARHGRGRRGVRGADRRGVSVNVTLLFDVKRYDEIAEAYVKACSARATPASRSTASLRRELLRLRGSTARSTSRSKEPAVRTSRARPRSPTPGSPTSLPAHLQRRRLGRAGGQGRQRAASAVGVDVDEEPRLPRHALRRRADRPGHGQHDARRDDRRRARPRHGGADGRQGLRRGPPDHRRGEGGRRRLRRHRLASARRRGRGVVRRARSTR